MNGAAAERDVGMMERRHFLESCAVLAGAGSVCAAGFAATDARLRRYANATLVDIHGTPVRAGSLVAETSYLFHYPFAATPCFLLNLGQPLVAAAALTRSDGASYRAPEGVGPGRAIVAFSAICAHKLAYPTREVSFIGFQRERSATSNAKVIHCCAEHSVYDPANGARVLAGPAPQPLAAIVLEHDSASDALTAVGTIGAEQFDAFFAKYDFKLALEYGPGGAKRPVAGRAVVRELAAWCRNPIRC